MTRKFLLILLLLAGGVLAASAQLTQPGAKEPGKNFWHGLTGRDSLSLTRVWEASLVVPGYAQAYNRDYWKIPVVWAGIGGFLGSAIYHNVQYQKTGNTYYRQGRNWSYAGMAASYWGSVLEGVVSYKTGSKAFVPSRATIYSAMLPGLGQIYNGDYWKLPIIYGGLLFTCYLVDFQSTQYNRYRTAYNLVSDGDPATVDEFNGRLAANKLQYYRDNSRRSRDYAILFTVLVYVLNIVDANVFATLHDFDVSDDLALRINPAVINYGSYALQSGGDNIALGLQMQWVF
ncbi:MAG: DUF5683 domain-containing protein [Prevotellaceae bacterium]|nr:DUF5683 domain-containing protein [Prevotellaceae bacterium]